MELADEQAIIEVPAIVECDLFRVAQEQRIYNRPNGKADNEKRISVTQTDQMCLWAEFCGTHDYHVCSGHHLKNEKLEKLYDEPWIRKSIFEPIVWKYVVNLISNSTDFEKKIRQAQMEEMRAVEPKKDCERFESSN